MTQKRIFLSYASPDFDVVDRVYKSLKAGGHSVFLDKYSLYPGPWRPQLDSAIRSRNVFIIFLSQNMKERFDSRKGYAAYEFDLAFQLSSNLSPSEFSIVPVRIDDNYRGDLSLQMYQQFDLFNDFENELKLLLSHIGEPDRKTKLVDEINSAVFRRDFVNAYAKIVVFEEIFGRNIKTELNKSLFLFNIGRKQEAINFAFDLLRESSDHNLAEAVVTMIVGAQDGGFAERALSLEYFSKQNAEENETSALGRQSLIRLLPTGEQEYVRSPFFATVYLTPEFACGSTDPWGLHYSPGSILPNATDVRSSGDVLEKGEPVVWLDFLMMYHEVPAESRCFVEKILVNSGDGVEMDQPLAVVRRI